MLILGCDPGASTGLVLVEAEAGRLTRILDRATLTRRLATADGYARHVKSIRAWLSRPPVARARDGNLVAWPAPDVIVVEDPTRLPDAWYGASRGRNVARGTGAKIGVACGCLLGALATSPVTEEVPIVAYPVTAWMHGLFGRGAKREAIYRLLAAMARTVTEETLPEDQLAALGVAAYHAQQTPITLRRP